MMLHHYNYLRFIIILRVTEQACDAKETAKKEFDQLSVI